MREHADQARQPHRAAAADENAARAFGQRVIGRALGDADVRRGRKLQPAADHRAVHHGDDRHAAELDLVEDAVPDARMRDAFLGREHLQLGEVEAGGEMLALGVEHHGLHARGQRLEERLEPEHGRVVERIALLGAREREDRDRAAPLGLQGFRQLDPCAMFPAAPGRAPCNSAWLRATCRCACRARPRPCRCRRDRCSPSRPSLSSRPLG